MQQVQHGGADATETASQDGVRPEGSTREDFRQTEQTVMKTPSASEVRRACEGPAGAGPSAPLTSAGGLKLSGTQQARDFTNGILRAATSDHDMMVHGYLLKGGNGVGKSHVLSELAAALEQSDVPVYRVEGGKDVADQMRAAFSQAREAATKSLHHSAVVMIDDLDVAAPVNSPGSLALVSEMGKLEGTGVMLVGTATDSSRLAQETMTALPRQQELLLPADRHERRVILESMAQKLPPGTFGDAATTAQTLDNLAWGTRGRSPGQLAKIITLGRQHAGENGHQYVTQHDLLEARLEESYGPPRPLTDNDWPFEISVNHEHGHVVVRQLLLEIAAEQKRPDWLLRGIDAVSFQPRGTAQAFVELGPSDNPNNTFETTFGDIATYYGGLAGEYLLGGGHVSEGPDGDVRIATELAENAVKQHGMGKRTGHIKITDSLAPLYAAEVKADIEDFRRTGENVAKAIVAFYAGFIQERTAAVVENQKNGGTLTTSGASVMRMARAWAEKTPQRQESLKRLKQYVLEQMESLRPTGEQIFDANSGQMVEAKALVQPLPSMRDVPMEGYIVR
jgi:hypothetical protein